MYLHSVLYLTLLACVTVQSSHWIRKEDLLITERHQHGIKNDGNTCYVASLIQLLFNVHHFRHAVLQYPTAHENEVLLALQITFSRMLLNRQSISTHYDLPFSWLGIKYDFLDMMRHLNVPRLVNQEGDTFELLEWVLNRLPSDLKSLFKWKFRDTIVTANISHKLQEEESYFLTLNASDEDGKRFEVLLTDSLVSNVEDFIPNQKALKTTQILQVPSIAIFRLVREDYRVQNRSNRTNKTRKTKTGAVTMVSQLYFIIRIT